MHESVQPTCEEVADWVRNLALSVCRREHEVFGIPLRTASHWLTFMKERVPEPVSMKLLSSITDSTTKPYNRDQKRKRLNAAMIRADCV